MSPEEMVDRIQWYGAQASIRIDAGGKVVYVDPYNIPKQTNDADVVLITHTHQDHFSIADIGKVAGENTVFIGPKECAAPIHDQFKKKITISAPGMKTSVGGTQIDAVPAYNIRKTQFHPRSNNWVGYILTVDGARVYHAGDTERIPEMKDISCDIALLPLGQTYTMDSVEDAAGAAVDVQAKIAIPIHFGMYEGAPADAEKFAKLLEGKVNVTVKAQVK